MKATWVVIFSLLTFVIEKGLAEVNPDDDAKLTKEITKGFRASQEINVLLTNKYGQILVHTWDHDSVGVRVTVTVEGKNEAEAGKQMDRVQVEMRQSLNQIALETVFDRSSQFFKDLWNAVSDVSRTASGKSRISVNYELYVPSKANLDVNHKFGNVVVDGLQGKLKLDLNHGDFTTGNLTSFANISLGFGRGKIGSLETATISLKGASLVVAQANQLELNSASSEVELGTIKSLKLETSNDLYSIEKVSTINGKAQFSELKIQQLEKTADLTLFYGGLFVEHVEMNFELVNLTAKSTQVRADFDVASSFSYQLKGREDRIYLPAEFSDLKRTTDVQNEKNVFLEGIFGYNDPTGKVNIQVENGDLTIKLAPTLPYSSHKK